MQNNTNIITSLVIYIIKFFLDSFKNSQFINLIILSLIYFFIFLTITLGLFFSLYETQTLNFITQFSSYFYDINSNANIQLSTNGTVIIRYYFFIIFVLGLIQEFILITIKSLFKKDFYYDIKRGKRILFFLTVSIIFVIECFVSIILKEWSLLAISMVSSLVLIFFYLWYGMVLKVIDQIKSKLPETM